MHANQCMWHCPCGTKINSVRKFEEARVRNIYAYEYFCHYSIVPPGPIYYPGQKKRTIIEIHGEKNAVPRVISCSIRRDQRRASPIRDCLRLLPCADRAWSSMISHVEQRSSRRESRWFFFLSRVVLPAIQAVFDNDCLQGVKLQMWSVCSNDPGHQVCEVCVATTRGTKFVKCV